MAIWAKYNTIFGHVSKAKNQAQFLNMKPITVKADRLKQIIKMILASVYFFLKQCECGNDYFLIENTGK